MPPGPLEGGELFHESLAASKQPRGQPHQLPSPLFAQPVPVVCQLLHNLAVDFVPEDLVLEWSFEDLVCQLVARPCPSRRQVAHILEDSVEDQAGLVSQLFLVHQLLEQGELQGLSGVAPQPRVAVAWKNGMFVYNERTRLIGM